MLRNAPYCMNALVKWSLTPATDHMINWGISSYNNNILTMKHVKMCECLHFRSGLCVWWLCVPVVTHTPPLRTKKITYLFLLVVCSYSHRVRGVQSPPGQSGDGIPGLLHPTPAGSGAGALPGRVPVGQDAGDHRPDAGCAVPRGRWVRSNAPGGFEVEVSPVTSWHVLLRSDLHTAKKKNRKKKVPQSGWISDLL